MVIVEVDHALLTAVNMWHAHVVDVVAYNFSCRDWNWHVSTGVHGVTVGMQAIFTREVACVRRP
eukprot:6179842-Pleurochrysis_carterae.AAC.5